MPTQEVIDVGSKQWGKWVEETKQLTNEQIKFESEQTDRLHEDSEMRRYIDIGIMPGHYDF